MVSIVVSYLHYQRYAEKIKPLLFHQNATVGQEEEVGADTVIPPVLDNGPHSRDTQAYNHVLGHFDETDDNLDFRRYIERDDNEAKDILLEEEVVEITLDLGRMEENLRRLLTRMHRVII